MNLSFDYDPATCELVDFKGHRFRTVEEAMAKQGFKASAKAKKRNPRLKRVKG